MAKVNRTGKRSFQIVPDEGEQVTWGITQAASSGYTHTHEVTFLPQPFVWFGTKETDESIPLEDRRPRQFRLYADGTLKEGPPGKYDPSIRFPVWKIEEVEPKN